MRGAGQTHSGGLPQRRHHGARCGHLARRRTRREPSAGTAEPVASALLDDQQPLQRYLIRTLQAYFLHSILPSQVRVVILYVLVDLCKAIRRETH